MPVPSSPLPLPYRPAIPSLSMNGLAHALGLAPSIKPINVIAFCTSAFLSISFLVYLNASSSFFLSNYLDPPPPENELGSITGTLLLADELLSLAVVLIWGTISDRTEVRVIVVCGHSIIGLAFLLFTTVKSAFPGYFDCQAHLCCNSSFAWVLTSYHD